MIALQNCKVVGDGIGHDEYAKQKEGVKRGDSDFVMSRGELMTFAECPAKWVKNVPNESTKSTDFGDLIDCLLLSPAKSEMRFVTAPATYADGKDWTYKAKFCQQWRAEREADGLTVVSDGEMKKATTALVALQKNMDVMELIECSKTQVMETGEYKDKETSIVVPLKVLLDLVPDKSHDRFGKSLSDFKTAKSAAMFQLGRQINDCHYDAQAALYTACHVAATGEDRVDWALAVQENTEPFHSEIYTMSSAFVEIGEMKVLKALKLYCWCLANDTWPGYGFTAREMWNGIAILPPEPWMVARLSDFCPIPNTGQTTVEEAKEMPVDLIP